MNTFERGIVAETPSLPQVFIEDLGVILDNIPEAACELCGSNTLRTLIPHTMPGDSVIIHTLTPGYRCIKEECGVACFSNEGLVATFGAAIPILENYGDHGTAEIFRQQIAVEQGFIKQSQSSENPIGNS